MVKSELENIDIPSLGQRGVTWIHYLDWLKNYVWQIGEQRYADYFKRYAESPETSVQQGLNDFVTSLVTAKFEDSSLKNLLNNFHKDLFKKDETLFVFLKSTFDENDQHLCSLTQSPYQLMYNLYNIVALTELKGYAMLQFSYMILRINEKGNFTAEAEAAKKNFEDEATEKLMAVKTVLPQLERLYRRCDPVKHVEGQTFLQVKGFMQGYIENEVDMNERGTCNSKCSEYSFTENKGCFKDQFCAKQKKCSGRIFDCEFYHADAWVCMSQDPERRYDG